MKIILLKDLQKKGKKGNIIEVSDGYALNYLIPNGIGKFADSTSLNENNQALASINYKSEQERLSAIELDKKLRNLTLKITVKCGIGGKIFGSVTNKEIAEKLENQNLTIDKRKIETAPIKNVGTYTVKLKLHPTITSSLKIEIVAE